jgi:hypothetical protein
MLIFLWLIELLSATKWYKNIDEKTLASDFVLRILVEIGVLEGIECILISKL